jgi:Ca2+-binding RTX toxin-like protein
MPTVKIGDQTSSYMAGQADTTYLLQAGKEIAVASGNGIDANAMPAGNRAFLIDGVISGAAVGIYDTYGQNAANSITIGKTGFIYAKNAGIALSGDAASVVNDGTINVNYVGALAIHLDGVGATMTNNGVISAGNGSGIIVSGADAVITNSGEIVASTIGLAVGGGGKLVNSGSITGLQQAYLGSAKADILVNSGMLNGAVNLGDGDDIFRSRGGHVNGTVNGGGGDDRYYIDDAHIKLHEDNSGGYDRIYSSVSWTLGDYFDEATLTGKRNIKLIGNDFGSTLTGNAGNNRIIGHLGSDAITGGRGNDVLTGDDGVASPNDTGDVFIFKNHSGHDVITDFHDGEDAINLANYKGIEDFADLKGHIAQSGNDVVLTLLDGDHITLRNAHTADIDATDFIF